MNERLGFGNRMSLAASSLTLYNRLRVPLERSTQAAGSHGQESRTTPPIPAFAPEVPSAATIITRGCTKCNPEGRTNPELLRDTEQGLLLWYAIQGKAP